MKQVKLPTSSIPQILQSPYRVEGRVVYAKYLSGEGVWQVVVPQRLTKTKVKHNYLKRRLREAVRRSGVEHPSLAVIYVAKKEMHPISQAQLVTDIKQIGETLKNRVVSNTK